MEDGHYDRQPDLSSGSKVMPLKSIDTSPRWCYIKINARKTFGGREETPPFTGCRKSGGRLPKKEIDSHKRALLCVNACCEKKALNLVILNVKEISAFADYFILCSGSSDRQVRAVAAAIQENLKKEGLLPLGVEGEDAGRWILLDYDDVIIHVFLESIRTFYDLERLWSDAPRMSVPEDAISLKALAEGM